MTDGPTKTGEKHSPLVGFFRRFMRVILITAVCIVGLIAGMVLAFTLSPSGDNRSPEEIAAADPTFGKTMTTITTAPPKREIPDGVTFVSLSIAGTGTKRAELHDLVIQADGVTCDITEILGLYRPEGGVYCAVPLLLTVQNETSVTVSALNQILYGVPPRLGSPDGYRSTFFINEDNERVDTITIDPGKARNVRLIADVHEGFLANQLLPQEH